MSEELSTIGSWLIRQLNTTTHPEADRESLHLVLVVFARLSIQESATMKSSRLLKLLEALLTFKACGTRLGLQWLAAILAYWCQQQSSESTTDDDDDGMMTPLGYLWVSASAIPHLVETKDLLQVLELAMQDLPNNLAAFASREKMSLLVANHVHRLFASWSSMSHVDADLLETLHQANVLCQRTSPLNEDALVSLAALTLQSV
jgi:hypothetical protein